LKGAELTTQDNTAMSGNSAAGNQPDRSHLMLLAELLVFSIGLSGCLIMQLDRVQPSAYMDEIFHVPMAQKYCQGIYTEWDSKITTPPGLYAMSAAVLRLAGKLTGSSSTDTNSLCSVFFLRLTNLVYFLISFLSVYGILSSPRHYDVTGDSGALPEPRVRVLKSFSVSLLPVSFFFVSLFYTDQASTACLLAAYFMQLNEHRLLAGLLGCLAVACRQTNAVWLLFFLGMELDRAWQARLRGLAKRREEDEGSEAAAPPLSLWSEASAVLGHPLQFFVTGCRVAFQSWPLVAVLVAFAVFVRLNGGVALGDRSAHEARLHSPQALYFLGFCVAMHPAAAARLIWAAARAPGGLKARWIRGMALPIVVLSALVCLAVRYQTYEHPYLLADNRHLTFYIWQRVFQRHWLIRYLLIPAYIGCLLVYWHSVPRSCLFRLALLGCSALALVPASLIEPRYFIAPWLLWRLSAVRHDSRPWLLAEAAYFAAVNAAVYWLFLKRPFLWPGVPEEQRFVW
ncbi:hypothetical protein BOX15_Mlig022059g2, partial [Macrostomum lignano]|uniref:Dol-P-Glc:Glc(2)Man(9)GlcNAc(2)-PP-Dol alpha-1,2-glucosyltransferase n=2 Tax=Macrostomum lignano TaxID=282301 RepID=A0A1I8FZE2_9PLAT